MSRPPRTVLKCVGRMIEELEISFVEHGDDSFPAGAR